MTPVPVPELEAQVLSALLQGDSQDLDAAADVLTPADFGDKRAQLVFEALLALHEQNRPTDLVTVAAVLQQMGQLAAAGGPAFLAAVTKDFPAGFSRGSLPEWLTLLREAGARRQLATLSRDVDALAKDATVPVSTVLEEAGRRFSDVLVQRQRSAWRSASSVLDEALASLDARKKSGGFTGLSTGLPDADRLLRGLQPGELVILAARPGVGKTAFALHLCRHAASTAVPAGVFSLEMPSAQLMDRVLAAEARVDAEKLRAGRLSSSDEDRIADAAERVFAWPLFLDDTAGVNSLEIRSKARRLKQLQPTMGLLVVDYLQLVRVRQRTESRQVEVAEVSRSLKELAKELALPVVALAQLSRRVEERGGKPRLSDLRESGAIEQDADVVLFLHRDSDEEEEEGQATTTSVVPLELIAAKQRSGPVGSVPIAFLPATMRFEGRIP